MGDTSRGRNGRGPGGGRHRGPRREDRRRDGRGEPHGALAVGSVDEVTVVVDRREGVRVLKVSRVERAFHRVVGVLYRVEFEDCEPIDFDRLGAARDRAREPAPERPSAAREPAPERPSPAQEPAPERQSAVQGASEGEAARSTGEGGATEEEDAGTTDRLG